MIRRHIPLYYLLLFLFLPMLTHAKIVFSSERDGVKGIYIMDDDGSNQTLLMEDKSLGPYPQCWFPDGKQILFKRRHRPNRKFGLFLMNGDATNIRQLTEDDGSSINGGSFSPDGKSIVFYKSIRIDEKWDFGIYVLNIETGKLKEIANIHGIQCQWSPDGKRIVFAWPQNSPSHTIWIMDSDGHNPRRLVPEPVIGDFITYRSQPHWSPDSQQIVFVQKEYKYVNVPVMIPDVGNVRRSALVFKAFRYFICDRTGENLRQLRIPKDYRSYGIDWMDDGKSVVFSARAGIPLNKPLHGGVDFVWPPCYIYKYHIRTGEITQLTNDPGLDQTIDWISDDVLSVTPHGKKKVTWGALKQQNSK